MLIHAGRLIIVFALFMSCWPLLATGQQLTPPLLPERLRELGDLDYERLAEAAPQPDYRSRLDFDPAQARYFDLVRKELQLTEEEVSIFRRQGFVSLDNGRRYTFSTAYYDIYSCDLPVLITSDSILHALHKSYDEILKELETTWFTWTLDEMLAEMHLKLSLEGRANSDPQLAENYRDVDLYLTVARNLLAGQGVAPRKQPRRLFEDGSVQPTPVRSMLGQDEEAAGRLRDIESLKLQRPRQDPPTRIYGGTRFVDYSQFQPRGHYTKSAALANYFRCMMWLSRADCGWNVLPTDGTPGVESDSQRELRDAVLFVELLRDTGNRDRLFNMDQVIKYLIGRSDSLNVFQLEQLLDKAAVSGAGELLDTARVSQLQDAIDNSQSARQLIRSQVVISDPNDTYKVPPPATFQAFGQRFAVDSYVLSHVVFDSIIYDQRKQRRMMPRGLDVMASLGNNAAVPLLESDLRKWNYSANLLAGRQFVRQQRAPFWSGNVYNLWLDCLRELDTSLAEQEHAPQVMQTRAWQMKQLQTQLASWAQLRHDTILYAKQPFTAFPACEYPDGYVEPYPELFAKVQRLADRAAEMLREIQYLSVDERRNSQLQKIHAKQLAFFETMSAHVARLQSLARKELAAEPFTADDRQFLQRTINSRGSVKFGSGGVAGYDGWYSDLLYKIRPHDTDAKWEATIVDVHTDPQSKQALEVGVGNLNLCVIAVDNQDDHTVYVGPLFSYYEFQHSAEDRMTDEKWQQMLGQTEQPARPAWTGDFQAPASDRSLPRSTVSTQRSGDHVSIQITTVGDSGTRRDGMQTQLTDKGLAQFSRLPTLRTLDVSRSPVSDAGLAHLAPLTNLRAVNLSSTRVDGSGLEHLSQAEWLRVLLLRNTQVSDDALAHVKRLPRLEQLDLSGTRVTNAGLPQLHGLSNLRWLNLERTSVDEAGIQALREAVPKCEVQF